ncbi:MAG: methyltransferase domain-containing protein [Patescibacteria group bacterium]|nr:methyltransferase domain-containing protein [Patescibacteria group bacterium]
MFENFINIHDFSILYKTAKEGKLNLILSKLTSSKQGKVEKSWEHTKKLPVNWYNIPEVKWRWNHLISGDARIDYYEYIFHKYFPNKKNLKALSLGCGTGHNELEWAKFGAFKNIDAYDLSKTRIEFAKKEAVKKGYSDTINYRIADVYKIKERNNYYDIVLVEHSLHHFSPLKDLLLQINSFLKADGFFIVNEFVGPTRFQWTDRQLEIINGLLSILPTQYKTKTNGSIKRKVFKPSRLSMILNDPSEAIESSNILFLLRKTFEIKEVKEYGGTILMMLFSEIAHNFLSKNNEAKKFLDICFDTEDILLQSKDIQSDFVVAVCKKKQD